RLSPDEVSHNELMAKVAKSFSDKALAAREYRLDTSQSGMRKWEEQQSANAKRFDAEDHKQCIDQGLDPSVWGNPDTEQYSLCRAGIIGQRAPALPAINKNYEQRAPEAALFFYRRAREAQYAFKAVDYET